MCSSDISGASDHVDRQALLRILVELGVPDWLVKWIASFLSLRRSQLRAPGHTSDWFYVNIGIPQGSPLSPILFIIFAGPMLDISNHFSFPSVELLDIQFSDDFSLLVTSDSWEENCRIIEKVFEPLFKWAKKVGIDFDPGKFLIMHFRKPNTKGPVCKAFPSIEGMPSSCVKQVARVLGVQIDVELTFSAQVYHIISKVQQRMAHFSRMSGSVWEPSTNEMRHLYITSVRPIIAYACAAWYIPRRQGCQWSLQANLVDLLDRLQYTCVRQISGAMKSTPNLVVHNEMQIEPIDLYLKRVGMAHRARNFDTAEGHALKSVRASFHPANYLSPT